jgi:site-specific recombinase XerD
MAKWIKAGTPGVRYRQHSTRKHGVKFDRYFSIRYRVNGKQNEEGLGWASEGWSEKKAAAILSELKANKTNGSGPLSLKEKRQIEQDRRTEEIRHKEEETKANITLNEIFKDYYLPVSKANKVSKSWKREEQLFRLWVSPQIGNKPMRQIAPLHLEKIKKSMSNAGRSPRSIQYMLATVRQVFNYALTNGLLHGLNPASGKSVKRPQIDNRRTRFLTMDEQTALLSELAKRSRDVHDIALFSLRTGARAGEIFSLTWGNTDPFTGTALLRDTKNNKNRHLYFTDDVKKMLIRRKPAGVKKNDLIFPDKNGNKVARISSTFYRIVHELQLNKDVADRRDKATFHTLRHTYASMLVQKGVDIYHVKELLGHSSIALTERYSHLSESTLKHAALMIQSD